MDFEDILNTIQRELNDLIERVRVLEVNTMGLASMGGRAIGFKG